MDENDFLLPCPFCGHKTARGIYSAEEVLGKPRPDDECECYAVVCDGSGPKGPGGCGASSGFKQSRQAAREAWNQRR